jgi:uncharacterized protein DUF5818
MTSTFLKVATLILLFGATLLYASTNATGATAPKTRSYEIQPPATSENPVQTFAGTIVSKNGQFFVLRDEANGVWYHLDDQKEAAKFLGKNVLVTGTLDGYTDTIRVQTIQEESA